METTAAFRSAMVSRLPKFGGRSSNGANNSLSNGSIPQASPQDGKTTHPNCVIRAPSFSFKWKKDDVVASRSPTIDYEEGPNTQHVPPTKEVKRASPGTPKMRRSGPLMVAVSSPKAIPKHSAKTGLQNDTNTKTQSQINGSSKVTHYGSARAVAESLPVRSKLLTTSPRSSSQDSLSQPSDNLNNLSLENIVRSNSFTHFKQIPSPSSQPMTRSFSFNRAVELAKPLANTQLRPPRTSLLKPPQLSNGRVGLGMAGLNGNLSGSGSVGMSSGVFNYSRNPPSASSLPSLSSPSAPNTPTSLKKPLLPNCVLNKSLNSKSPSAENKLVRSSQVKQQPLLPGRAKERLPALAPCSRTLVALASEVSEKAETSDFHSDSDGSSRDKTGLCGTNGETLEDMSLSSASSLDRGDTSEEFLDDFDSSGDVLSDVDLMENSDGQNWPQKLVDDTADWPPPNLAESKDISPMDMSCGSLVLSPESSQAAAGSFIELSPSNSSGGTYMWDEEGLEPIGGSVSHPGDEYEDTDLNSLDLLNNLKPLGATDPEQDDLMLDVELPEDGVHEMSHMEPSERGRLGSRRRHHRWGAPDHFHNSSRVHSFPHYDGFKAPRFSSGPCYSEGKQHIPALELTLDMSQDCSALKSHLLRLQDLLQLEDADSPAEADEAGADDKSTALQELMKEVQDLREELRSRDRTIAQLTLQCQQLQQKQPQQMGHQGRCQCYHQRAPHPVMDKRKQHHHDKATQTHYRPPANTGVLPSPMLSPWQAQAQHQGQSRPSMPPRRHTSNTTAFQPPPQRAAVPGKTNKSSLHRGPQ
ncbi:unnamed protein product [Knipowitschia caucasica]